MTGRDVSRVFWVVSAALALCASPSLAAVEDCSSVSKTQTAGPPEISVAVIEGLSTTPAYSFLDGSGNAYCLTDPEAAMKDLSFQIGVTGLAAYDVYPDRPINAAQMFLRYAADNYAGDGIAFQWQSDDVGEPGSAAMGDASPFQVFFVDEHIAPASVGGVGEFNSLAAINVPGDPSFVSACDNGLANFTLRILGEGRLKIWFEDPAVGEPTYLGGIWGTPPLPNAIFPDGACSPGYDCDLVFGQTHQAGGQLIITVDWTPPTIACPDDITQANDPAECGANITVPAPDVSDNCGVASVTNSYTGTDDASGIYPVGSTTVTWTVTDECGNESSCTQTVTVVDEEDPTIGCPGDIEKENDLGVCGAYVVVPPPDVDDKCGVAIVVNDYNGTGDASDFYPVGETIVTWTVTDIYGNSAHCTHTITVIDTEDPTIECPDDIEKHNDPEVCEAYVTVPPPDMDDNCGVASVVNDYNGTADASDAYPVGETIVTWTITDIHGNSTLCSHTITIFDAESPVLVCPPDITIDNDPGECEADVEWPPAYAHDNCDGDISDDVLYDIDLWNDGTIDVSDFPGTTYTFPVGTHRVIAKVEDAAGNGTTCEFWVTVEDHEAPSIACPPDIIVTPPAGSCEALVDVPPPVTGDNCGVHEVVNDYNGTDDASGIYPPGVTTVTWTVIDIHGNENQCSHTVTVLDTNEMVVSIEILSLDPAYAPVTRCITFELWECSTMTGPIVVEADLVFDTPGVNGGVAAVDQLIDVPCGNYTCITARDKLHTLRRAMTEPGFAISGTQYVADFYGEDEYLIGGNLNDDCVIDIQDYVIYAFEWGQEYDCDGDDTPDGDTLCEDCVPPWPPHSPYHADLNGNGIVEGNPDLHSITTWFWEHSEPNCCGAEPLCGPVTIGSPCAPRERISVAELRELGIPGGDQADLNKDDWVDTNDVVLWMMGERPTPETPDKPVLELKKQTHRTRDASSPAGVSYQGTAEQRPR